MLIELTSRRVKKNVKCVDVSPEMKYRKITL